MKTTTRQELDKMKPQEIIDYLKGRQDVIWATYETPDDFQMRIQEVIEQNDIKGGEESATFYYTDWADRFRIEGMDLKQMAFEYYEKQYEHYFPAFIASDNGHDLEHSQMLLDKVLKINDKTLPNIALDIDAFKRQLALNEVLA